MKMSWFIVPLIIVTCLAVCDRLTDSATAAPKVKAVRLFNGKDLAGWTPMLWDGRNRKPDTATPVDRVWTVNDGILMCSGRPTGYLRSKATYENYKLEFEWRWSPGSNGGNSGVLVHTTTPEALGQWPKSVEVQLFRRNAGDFWTIGTELDVENESERKKGRRHLNLTDDSEKEIGEWNRMVVTCQANEIVVHVNGDLVNSATNCTETKGAICFQAEGAAIHFRNIVLTPLE